MPGKKKSTAAKAGGPAKKAPPAKETAGGGGVVGKSTSPVTESHRKILEIAAAQDFTPGEWASLRQCLRCLLQGSRLVSKGGRRRAVVKGHKSVKTIPPTTLDAITEVLEEARRTKGDVLKAARNLVYVDE